MPKLMETALHSDTPATAPHDRRRRRKSNGGDQTDVGSGVVTMLQTLDHLLGLAVDKTARMLGPATLLDPWRGMHLDADEVRRVIARGQPASLTYSGAAERLAACLLRTEAGARLCEVAQLDMLDLAIVAIALAPDIDLRYERIYAYLQDDVSRKRPCPDLIANLLLRIDGGASADAAALRCELAAFCVTASCVGVEMLTDRISHSPACFA